MIKKWLREEEVLGATVIACPDWGGNVRLQLKDGRLAEIQIVHGHDGPELEAVEVKK